jgi:hypothetical protein
MQHAKQDLRKKPRLSKQKEIASIQNVFKGIVANNYVQRLSFNLCSTLLTYTYK